MLEHCISTFYDGTLSHMNAIKPVTSIPSEVDGCIFRFTKLLDIQIVIVAIDFQDMDVFLGHKEDIVLFQHSIFRCPKVPIGKILMVFLSEEGGSPECGHRLVDDAIGGNRRHFDELDACGLGVQDVQAFSSNLHSIPYEMHRG